MSDKEIREILDKEIFNNAFANLNELLTFRKITDMEYRTRVKELEIKRDLIVDNLQSLNEEVDMSALAKEILLIHHSKKCRQNVASSIAHSLLQKYRIIKR